MKRKIVIIFFVNKIKLIKLINLRVQHLLETGAFV